MAKNRARPVEEPSGYDYAPTDRIPVQDERPDNRVDGRPDHMTDNRVDEHMDHMDGHVGNGLDNRTDDRTDDRLDGGVDSRMDDRLDGKDGRVDDHAGTRPVDGVGTMGGVGTAPVGDPMVDSTATTQGFATGPADTATVQEPATGTAASSATGAATSHGTSDKTPDFFDNAQIDGFRDRWRELQAGFVDDPAQAVRGADDLVDEIMRELTERKKHLAGRWHDGSGGSADTEELRVVIREYRAFFDRLLKA